MKRTSLHRPARCILILLAALGFLLFTFSPAVADSLKLKSGETVTGEIEGETGTDIKIKTKGNTLVIPKSTVEEIKRELVELRLHDGRIFKGKIVKESKESLVIRHIRKSAWADIPVDKLDIDTREEKVEIGPPDIWKRQARKLTKFEKGVEFPEATENLSQQEIMQLRRQAGQALRQKDYKTAEKHYHKILKTNPKDVNSLYNLACIYSLTKKFKQAEKYLKMSILAGWIDFGHMERDPDLDPLRKRKFYKNILKQRDQLQRLGADRVLERLRKEYGEDYTYEIDEKRKLIFATNRSMEMLARMKDHLARFADAQWRDNFKHKPTYYITIVCPSQQDFVKIRQRNRLPANAGGWYNNGQKILICGNIGGTLDHEFTHALHYADMEGHRPRQQHPIWILEGLATCFEAAGVAAGHLVPHKVSGRLRGIQSALQRGSHIPLATFARYTHRQYMQNAGLCYAQGRYIMVYLYYQKKLRAFYEEYCKTFNQDRTGVKALAKVMGKSIQQIEANWKPWVLALKQERSASVGAGGAYVGVQTIDVPEGVAFSRGVAGGPAEKAGLEEGDLLLEFGGKKVKSHDAFIAELKKYKPGDKVKVRVQRGKKKKTLTLELGKRPGRRR